MTISEHAIQIQYKYRNQMVLLRECILYKKDSHDSCVEGLLQLN